MNHLDGLWGKWDQPCSVRGPRGQNQGSALKRTIRRQFQKRMERSGIRGSELRRNECCSRRLGIVRVGDLDLQRLSSNRSDSRLQNILNPLWFCGSKLIGCDFNPLIFWRGVMTLWPQANYLWNFSSLACKMGRYCLVYNTVRIKVHKTSDTLQAIHRWSFPPSSFIPLGHCAFEGGEWAGNSTAPEEPAILHPQSI